MKEYDTNILLKTLKHAKIPIYYFRLKNQPGFEFISDEITNLIGYTPQEHYENPGLGQELVLEEDREILNSLFTKSDFSKPIVLRWKHKNGSIIWTEQKFAPDIEKGEIVGLIGVITDITKEKELNSLVSSLDIPICAWCGKIKRDNEYISVTDFLIANKKQVTHGICGECSKELSIPSNS